MSGRNFKANYNQKKIINNKEALTALRKEVDKAKKAQLGTDAWDARADGYFGMRKYLNAIEVVKKGSEVKKIDVTIKMIEKLKGGEFDVCDGLVVAVKDNFLNSTAVKKLIIDYVGEFPENANEAVSFEDKGIRTVKNPDRKLPSA